MTQTHYALQPLRHTRHPDKDVFVQLSTTSSATCVLFVHGYGGDTMDTWSNFHTLLPTDTRFKSVDLLYYGYDALRGDLTASAAILRDFLERLMSKPDEVIAPNLSLRVDGSKVGPYRDLVLVAHSLGAVITRRALVDATVLRRPWVKNTKLVLFAPAHSGAAIVELLKEVRATGLFGKLLSAVTVGAQHYSPLITQLAVGSAELVSLADDVKRLRAKGKNSQLSARVVTIAAVERIVKNAPGFPHDPPATALPNTTHTTVCKPRPGFLDPVSIVAQWI